MFLSGSQGLSAVEFVN